MSHVDYLFVARVQEVQNLFKIIYVNVICQTKTFSGGGTVEVLPSTLFQCFNCC